MNSIKNWLTDLARVIRREFTLTFKDVGVLIFFVLLPLAYPVVEHLI